MSLVPWGFLCQNASMLRTALLPLIALALAACQKDETLTGYGGADAVWQLVEVNGQSFSARAEIEFPAEGDVTGQGPCNSFSGKQTLPYPWIKIENLAATRAACPDLEAEGAFFAMLMAASQVEIAGDTMILSSDHNLQMIFTAQPD